MNKHITAEITSIFHAQGFTPVSLEDLMTDWSGEGPSPESDTPAMFYHADIDAYFVYAPEIVDGMWDGRLQELGAIAVIDDDVTDDSVKSCADLPLQLIRVKDIPAFVEHYELSPAYFESLVAKLGGQTLNIDMLAPMMSVTQVSMELWRAEKAASLARDAYLRKIQSYERRHGFLKGRLSAEAPEHAAVREFTAKIYETHQALKRQVYTAKRRLKSACLALAQSHAAHARQQAAHMAP